MVRGRAFYPVVQELTSNLKGKLINIKLLKQKDLFFSVFAPGREICESDATDSMSLKYFLRLFVMLLCFSCVTPLE
jgi:hypothetical protein